jgi:hypothetical protein
MDYLDILNPELLIQTRRVRTTRPMVHELGRITIKSLRDWGLLRVGEKGQRVIDHDITISTNLVGRRPFCRVGSGKASVVLPLVSRPLGRSLCWYFREPTGELVRIIYFTDDGYGSRRTVGALYASQLRDKIFGHLLQINKLVLAIDGDHYGRIGPARGSSREKKIARLRKIYTEVRDAEQKREIIFKEFPALKKTYRFAAALLRRESRKKQSRWSRELGKRP